MAGKLAYRLKSEGATILLAAGDTFRAAASDQLEIWAERTGCEIVSAEKEKAKASAMLSQAVKKGKEQGFDIVLCDTSGHLRAYFTMLQEILLVLDGTTGLNMLQKAREFNEVSVVDELGIPVKFVGVGERVEDLQPFEAEAFVNAIFS
ncbi:hypothetical protein L1987_73120 [Smallanthus sonchifolius]|uniref:Uncharacterized protein n=1 Tax=Smallanthus sonchifolius TaxID=185202 RepID=A0ACB9A0R5_9ASTR|nr:hypothetical protein L1987_73120 [Smallanthus sonchifolius]